MRVRGRRRLQLTAFKLKFEFLLGAGGSATAGRAAQHPFTTRPKELDADYVPSGFCEETAPGVFEREWTKADVSINCNSWTAQIQMKRS